ncbi:LUD domain-containing protein [Cellulophaga omnivescoria]|uniref:LUD domain-containing protein n=1 Tax=Cellulophaga omnivescoria TaxID=1888890 RepID=UPI000984ED75|nr:LUD domain-containing protein [Cellulophaga omnivescoria]
MSIFGKLFGTSKKKSSDAPAENRGVHMPELDLPIDEKFTIYFKKNGGKFIYCDSDDEVSSALQNIVEENDWRDNSFFSLDDRLEKKFANEHISFSKSAKKSTVFFTTCEHLIAQNGSILISSNQLKERKMNELPENFIVYATTSQLTASLGDGLKSIKKKYQGSIPANITTIKHFQSNIKEEDDFLSYGSTAKNLYLILMEDL